MIERRAAPGYARIFDRDNQRQTQYAAKRKKRQYAQDAKFTFLDNAHPIHSLRHTFASRAVQRGVPIEIVSKLLDHSSVAITARVYARFSQEQMDDAVSRIFEDPNSTEGKEKSAHSEREIAECAPHGALFTWCVAFTTRPLARQPFGVTRILRNRAHGTHARPSVCMHRLLSRRKRATLCLMSGVTGTRSTPTRSMHAQKTAKSHADRAASVIISMHSFSVNFS